MFDEIKGHNKQKEILKNQLENNHLAHAYIFSGPPGIGKETLAKLFGKEIIKKGLFDKDSSGNFDLISLDTNSNTIKVDQIRDLITQTQTKPIEGKNRVFLINEADRMNPYAQNALLKTLEEPNEGNYFVLVTSHQKKLLPTVLSRCQNIEFFSLSDQDVIEILEEKGILTEDTFGLSPGGYIKFVQDNDDDFKSYYNQFKKVLSGDILNSLNLAEELGKDKDSLKEILAYFIRRFNSEAENNLIKFQILETLFDLIERLDYNVNLRLQLESSFLQIATELAK